MPLTYPDQEWYFAISERKSLPGRCQFANIHRCPRHFHSTALLSDEEITTPLSQNLHDAVQEKWQAHEHAPVTRETATSITGSRTFSNFCPEVAFDTFRLFGSLLIRHTEDPIDQEINERDIRENPAPCGKDWRWLWKHVEPLHYSDCPLYAKLREEKSMSNVTINGALSGNINIAGNSIASPIMSLTITDLIAKIDASSMPAPEKEAAKSKLFEFLAHPVIAAIIGGLAGNVGG